MPSGHYWGATKPPAGVGLNRAHPLSRGLVALWPLAEGAGSHLQNVVAWGSQGTAVAGPAWSGGVHGSALTLTGTETVDLGNDADIKVAVGTIGAWVAVTGGTGYRGILNLTNQVASSWSAWALAVNGTSWQFDRQSGAGTDFSITAPQTSGWHLVVATMEPYALNLYVDGVRVATPVNTFPQAAFNYTAAQWNAVLGGSRNGSTGVLDSHFIGLVDSAFVVNRPWNASEVAAYYAAPFSMFMAPIWRRPALPAAPVVPPLTQGDITRRAPYYVPVRIY